MNAVTFSVKAVMIFFSVNGLAAVLICSVEVVLQLKLVLPVFSSYFAVKERPLAVTGLVSNIFISILLYVYLNFELNFTVSLKIYASMLLS